MEGGIGKKRVRHILVVDIETEESSVEDVERLVKRRLEEDERRWTKLSVTVNSVRVQASLPLDYEKVKK